MTRRLAFVLAISSVLLGCIALPTYNATHSPADSSPTPSPADPTPSPADPTPTTPPPLADYPDAAPATLAADTIQTPKPLTDPALRAGRPQFSPAGDALVFHGGPEGSRAIYLLSLKGDTPQTPQKLSADGGDHIDPFWMADGSAILWAAAPGKGDNHALWRMNPDGTDPQKLLDFPGDISQGTVSSIEYVFGAGPLSEGVCSYVPPLRDLPTEVDRYRKVVVTVRTAKGTEVWFGSTNGRHQGRLSPAGMSCDSPTYSGDGLSLAFVCEDPKTKARIVYDSEVIPGELELDGEKDRRKAVAYNPPPDTLIEEYDADGNAHTSPDNYACDIYPIEDVWLTDPCLLSLPRFYGHHAYESAARPHADALASPAYSTNQILLLASGPKGPQQTTRTSALSIWSIPTLSSLVPGRFAPAPWTPLPSGLPADATHLTWSPDGTQVAFTAQVNGSPTLHTAATDFYLQQVRDLHTYPEFYAHGPSTRLHENGFVVRPHGNTENAERELFNVYEQVNYAERAPFITADTALQVLQDELMSWLRSSELAISGKLQGLSLALSSHFIAALALSPDDPTTRYLATYFTVGAVLLKAAESVEVVSVSPYDYPEEEEDTAEPPTVEQQYAEALTAALASVPEPVRQDVTAYIALISAHAGRTEVLIPGIQDPLTVDWSQFKARGSYEKSTLIGYFMAVKWYGLMYLPTGRAASDLIAALEQPPITLEYSVSSFVTNEQGSSIQTVDVQKITETPLAIWQQIDGSIGSLIGMPADLSLSHLLALRRDNPTLFSDFNNPERAKTLDALLGPVPLRSASGLPKTLAFAFLPARVGPDAQSLHDLTEAPLDGRLPSSLDVFASLNNTAAVMLSLERERAQDAKRFAAYETALTALRARNDDARLLHGTDLFDMWMAMLISAATPHDADLHTAIRFARSRAWTHRRLSLALSGYTQLKHNLVLYNAQEYGSECDGGGGGYTFFAEYPVIPPPRGFIEPTPTFFERAANILRHLNTLSGHSAVQPQAITFIDYLAYLSQRAKDNALTDEDYAGLRSVGRTMESLLTGLYPTGSTNPRLDYGVSLIADIFNDTRSATILHIGIGRVQHIFVAVPDAVGERLTQGAVLSFFEFWNADRLSDADWDALLSKSPPSQPSWTDSFIEPDSPTK